MTNRWELEFHTTLMTLLRLTRNLRSMDCEHCADLLTQAYRCMASETQDIRERANNGEQRCNVCINTKEAVWGL
jgi:hypothetical protein